MKKPTNAINFQTIPRLYAHVLFYNYLLFPPKDILTFLCSIFAASLENGVFGK
jgi:hypothetical protein